MKSTENKTMTNEVIKTFTGKAYTYTYNGTICRTSKRDYKYACIATWKEGGREVIALGNSRSSTLHSMSHLYPGCAFMVVEVL